MDKKSIQYIIIAVAALAITAAVYFTDIPALNALPGGIYFVLLLVWIVAGAVVLKI